MSNHGSKCHFNQSKVYNNYKYFFSLITFVENVREDMVGEVDLVLGLTLPAVHILVDQGVGVEVNPLLPNAIKGGGEVRQIAHQTVMLTPHLIIKR